MTAQLIKREGKYYSTSKLGMETACEKCAEENGYHFEALEKSWKWAWQAKFSSENLGEFWGVMIAVPTGDKDEPFEADILFGPGQMVGSKGDYVVEDEEYYQELGMGD